MNLYTPKYTLEHDPMTEQNTVRYVLYLFCENMHKVWYKIFKDIHLANMAWWLKSAGALNFALSQEQCPISL